MFNLICCVKGMLFYLAMFKSQGYVGSHNCLCPWSLSWRLRTDLHLNHKNLNLCLIIGVSFQCLSFLLPVSMNLHPNCKDWGKKVWSVVMSSSTCVSGRYLLPSSTAYCISWENQKEKEKLLKFSMFLLFAKGRTHFVTEIAGGRTILV